MIALSRIAGLIACVLLFTLTTSTTGFAEESDMLRERINRGTVGVISGGVNGTYIRISSDLITVLDSDELRILSIVGKGSAQNIADLLYLRGIDIAIVQSDVLEFLRRQGTFPTISKRVNYVTKLYNEEFHLLARDDVTSVQDLSGKKVNFDRQGSGTAMTASLVFDTLDIAIEPTHFDQTTALQRLLKGEISALVYVAGQPVQLFQNLSSEDPVRFLSVGAVPELLATYLPSKLRTESYPNLLSADESVPTIAVGAVMAAYNWEPGNHRYTKVASFIERFFSNFEAFQDPARHPKWREVNLSATVPGWDRFAPAQEWLGANK